MKTIKLFLILVLVLTSCVTQRRCNIKFPPSIQRDNIRIEKIKEVPVYVPGDSIKVNVLVNCPDQNVATVETDRLKQEIKILNGRLVSNTSIKPDTVKIPVKEIETVVNVVRVTQPVKYTPTLVKWLAWIGGIGIGLTLAWIGWRVVKFIKP